MNMCSIVSHFDLEDRLAAAEAERDNLVIAVTRCNDEHVLKSDLAAAELHLFSGHGCDCRHMAERKAAYLGATEAYSGKANSD